MTQARPNGGVGDGKLRCFRALRFTHGYGALRARPVGRKGAPGPIGWSISVSNVRLITHRLTGVAFNGRVWPAVGTGLHPDP